MTLNLFHLLLPCFFRVSGVPDCDAADHKSLNKRSKYMLELQKGIRKRFRSEYLGSLIRRSEKTKTSKIAPGDIVLIKSDNVNRKSHWEKDRRKEK